MSGEAVTDPPEIALVDPPEADPPVVTDPPAPTRRSTSRAPRTFTEDDIEKARREERDKLYPRIQKVDDLEAELAEFRERETVAEKERKKQEKAAEEARLAAEREKMNAQELIESYRKEQEDRHKALEAELAKERALREKEREFSDLREYRDRRIMEEQEEIMPQLRDLVSGGTQQEIESSIERMKARTASILGEVQQTIQGQRATLPTTGPTGAPATGPLDMGNVVEMTADDIKNMTAEEYEAARPALHAAMRRARGQRG